MNLIYKSAFTFLFLAILSGYGSLCYSQSMEGNYLGIAVITSYDSNGKKSSQRISVGAEIDASNNFVFDGDVLSYNGNLIVRGKACAVYARGSDDSNYVFRGKVKPGKAVSGILYWISPTDFHDVKVKLNRVIVK